jgi:hypothetical protein
MARSVSQKMQRADISVPGLVAISLLHQRPHSVVLATSKELKETPKCFKGLKSALKVARELKIGKE